MSMSCRGVELDEHEVADLCPKLPSPGDNPAYNAAASVRAVAISLYAPFEQPEDLNIVLLYMSCMFRFQHLI